MNNFVASSIECYEENDVLVVAIGEGGVDPVNYLIMTRLDDEDNLSVDDGIGLQVSGATYEMSGAIKKLVLEESGLRVEVKPPFIDSLGGSSILVKFDEGVLELAGRISSLREALQELFNGSAVELVV
ncbi:hypothetical protein [Pseudomonas putida]|uniref:hypothetical protein n=1 Tax=Pseudomonas putida TaxID=303 RepID=UPI002DB915EC|nr:hypothetical protein [Pseudomonas putida]WRW01321.1 hypothetical protein VPZ82_16210 [Pseudomonas putida]